MRNSISPILGSSASSDVGASAINSSADNKFQALLETSSAAIVVVTPDWQLIDFNEAWCRFLGYERSELLGVSSMKLTHPDDQQISREHIESLVKGRGDTYRIEKRYIGKDGAVVWGDLSSTALRDETGAVEAIVATIVDITPLKRREKELKRQEEELKRREEELKASEAKFRDFAEVSSDWFWEQDDAFRYTNAVAFDKNTFVSQNINFLGLTRWEFAGVGPDEDAHWRQHVNDCLAHRRFHNFRYSVFGGDGKEHFLSISGNPVFNEAGEFKGYRGTASDITELVQSKSVNERFFATLDHLDESLALWDAEDRLVLVNENARKLAGKAEPFLRPGITYENWLLHLLKHDVMPEAKGREKIWLTERMSYFRNPEEGAEEILRNGRWHLFRVYELPDGGTMHCTFDIHEQKLKEEALRESEQRFKDFAESSSDWFWEMDENLRFSYFSEASRSSLGIDPSLFIGKTRQDMSAKTTKNIKWSRHLDDLKNHRPFRGFTYERNLPDGSFATLNVNGNPVFDNQGRFKGYRGTGSNITRTVYAESEIRRTRGLLYSAIDVMEDGFVLFDADDRLVICNQKYRDVYHEIADILKPGVTFTEIIQSSAESGQVFDSLEDKHAWIAERLQQHKNPSGPFEQRLSRGGWIRIIEQKTAEGGIISLRTDITQLKETELHLRESEEQFKDFANSTSDWFWETDRNHRHSYFSDQFEVRTGVAPDQLLGKTRAETRPQGIDDDAWDKLLADMDAHLEFRNVIHSRIRSNGDEIWISISGLPYFDKSNKFMGYRGTSTDITNRKRAEEASMDKSTFLAAASHDMRQPLQAMKMFLYALKSNEVSSAKLETIGFLEQSTASLGHILDSLLDLSRLESGVVKIEKQIFSVRTMFPRLIDEYSQAAAEKGLRLDFVSCSLNIYSDPVLLESILRNLISNAIKYTDFGRVLVGCRRRGVDQVEIQVWDTGKGIAKDQQSKIFNEFYQLDTNSGNAPKGLGLGLSIVQKEAELLNHELGISSGPGRGSMFSITVPYGGGLTADGSGLKNTGNRKIPENLSIVVIDDEEMVRKSLSVMLSNSNNRVVSAPCVDQLDEAKLRGFPRKWPDIIIADYRLANGETGVEEISRLCELFEKEIPAILLTGDTAPERLREISRSGYSLLHKPVNGDELLFRIQDVLSQEIANKG